MTSSSSFPPSTNSRSTSNPREVMKACPSQGLRLACRRQQKQDGECSGRVLRWQSWNDITLLCDCRSSSSQASVIAYLRSFQHHRRRDANRGFWSRNPGLTEPYDILGRVKQLPVRRGRSAFRYRRPGRLSPPDMTAAHAQLIQSFVLGSLRTSGA